MQIHSLLMPVALCAFTSAALAQSQTTISYESFDYPNATGIGGQTGGLGWENVWWSGGAGTDAMAYAPGHDAEGLKATTNFDGGGSYRRPGTVGFEYMIDGNGDFGADNSTVWISFSTRRVGGGDDQYGGLSLFLSGTGEMLFLGSPWQSNEWGIQDHAGGGVSHLVAGSIVDQMSVLVTRIDFQPGDERLRMWVDPADPHPVGVADIDVPIGDQRFDEIRIQSGGPITTHGYEFDRVHIETPSVDVFTALCFGDGAGTSCPCGNEDSSGSSGCSNSTGAGSTLGASGSDSVAAGDLVLEAAGAIPGQPGLFFQGENFVNSGNGVIFGDGLRCCGGNVVRLQVVVPDAGGAASTSVDVPADGGVAAGDTRCYQYWYRDPSGGPCGAGFNLSNAAQVDWQP